jgi:hypothetical protein
MSIHRIRRTADREYFLVSQDDIYKIDCMVGALNLAITEILERRPIREKLWETTLAQDDFNQQVGEIIHREDPIDF